MLYEPPLKTLEKITTEYGWDDLTNYAAYGLIKNSSNSKFSVASGICAYTLGFIKP